jgi:transcriptional antiterminator RfaH
MRTDEQNAEQSADWRLETQSEPKTDLENKAETTEKMRPHPDLPILPKKKDEDDKDLGRKDKNGNENHLHPTIPRWFAARTRFRDEKVAVAMLTKNEIEHYLPIKKLTRRYGKKKLRHVDMPLISSFVFVKIVKDQYVKVLQTEYIAGFLRFGNNILSIPDKQIAILRRLLGEYVDIEIEVVEAGFSKGDVVEITSGPLLGIQGILINVHGKDKMVVDLVNSGFELHMEIDKSLLRKV